MKYQKIRKPIIIMTALLFHSLLVFHLLFSPVIIILAADKGLVNASFISFLLILFLSLFLGRAYCGWFCPGCGVQEITAFWVKKKSPNSKAIYLKYFIFAAWLGTIIILYILRGIHHINLTFGMNDITIAKKMILTFGAVAIIVPLAFIFGKFASCKYICWQAPLMIIGAKLRDLLKLPGLRLKIDTTKCQKCNACSIQCPMNINLMANITDENVINLECILCGNCIDSCRFEALSFKLTVPASPNLPSKNQR
jgi:polyferredoxin